MPKRSQSPGNNDLRKVETAKVEQLNRAVDALLARTDGKRPKVDKSVQPLMHIAAALRDLPRDEFKTSLKAELLEGRNTMTAVAEPISAVRTTAMPHLTLKDAAEAIRFYERALGAVETFRFEAGGSIAHAEIKIGDSVFGVSDEWPEGGRLSAETWGHSPVTFRIFVDDVDSFAARAVAAGMKVFRPITDQFYGYREGNFIDPFGYTWNLVTVKEEMSVEEMHRRLKALEAGPEGGLMPDTNETKKGVKPIRAGFRMVTPYLVAEDGGALLDFAIQAFGAEELLRVLTPIGGVHGEVRMGDSILMMGGGTPGHKFPATLHPQALHVYVKDADAVCQKALAAGATLIDEPRDQEYGERSASVKDQAGNFWYIATRKDGNYKWEGAPDVQPYLQPLRAEPVINFLKRAFGAQELKRYAAPDGVIQHMTLKIGDTYMEMGEAHGKYEPLPAMFYLYVPNVDAVYRQAVAAGATSFQEPTDQPYGDRQAGVRDAFGYTWYIATHIKDMQ